ncbi:hypothetical protein EDD15DRAFT_895301 [Pisolithus albus]|nr:hypothetical protein EDD15DRAFT_895301 [Pisolithus albus]
MVSPAIPQNDPGGLVFHPFPLFIAQGNVILGYIPGTYSQRAVLCHRRPFQSGVRLRHQTVTRLLLFGILAWSKTRCSRCIRTARVMGCIGGNRKDSRISSLVLDYSDTYRPPYQSSKGPRLRGCLARETNAKWKSMQEGDRRERRQLGHITSHFDASESRAFHLGVAAGCFASSIFVGPTVPYLKLSFQDASIKRLECVLFFQ